MPSAASRARSVLDRFEAALAGSDIDAVMSLCTPEVVFFGSAHASVGRDATRAYLQQVIRGFAWIRWLLDPMVVVHADDDRVVVAGFGEVQGEEDGRELRLPFRVTLVIERVGEQWLVAHFHGSVPEGT
jgi:uncharacterized protein (TIGR02246 family)